MTYRTPDPATTIARLTRECERLRGELAAVACPPGRCPWWCGCERWRREPAPSDGGAR